MCRWRRRLARLRSISAHCLPGPTARRGLSDERSRGSAPAYGWQDFDPEVVEGLVENDSRFVNRRAGGWIACPLSGHFGEELAWQEDNYRKGSVLHGNPPASFRAAPTYVLERPLDNFIAGRELIAEAIAGKWGNAEAPRLGNENSEGALDLERDPLAAGGGHG